MATQRESELANARREFATADASASAREAEHAAAAAALRAIPGVGAGPMGLTPDAVKFSPAYQAAAQCERAAFHRLQIANIHRARTRKALRKAERGQA